VAHPPLQTLALPLLHHRRLNLPLLLLALILLLAVGLQALLAAVVMQDLVLDRLAAKAKANASDVRQKVALVERMVVRTKVVLVVLVVMFLK
jgi:hypothetical protein